MRWLVAAGLVCAACGDNAGRPAQLTLQRTGDVELVLVRDSGTGEAGWHAATLTSIVDDVSTYALGPVAADGYEVLVACTGPNSVFAASQIFATGLDPDVSWACSLPMQQVNMPPGPDAFVVVSGSMKQPGIVQMGQFGGAASTMGNWMFQLGVNPGPHDLIAMSPNLDAQEANVPEQIVVRRDVAVPDAVTVPEIDMDVDGRQMARMTFDLGGLGTDQTFIGGNWVTPHDTLPLLSSQTAVLVPPADLLVPTDKLPVSIEVTSQESPTVIRLVELDAAAGSPGHIDLLPSLGTSSYTASVSEDGGLTTTVAPIPFDGWQLAEVDMQASASFGLHYLVTTPGWLASHDGTMELDVHAPGFDDGWRLDTMSFFQCLRVSDGGVAVKQTTSSCNSN